ncbi:LAME_0G19570g1_1 [Lachancea meyersii CBS 8951]|uniref:LAME_0G19570g1_1 n=1 Tax=Lachancea meyersii CBS 8951 TaxID=1266667 RepID=A0A1G4KC47_9SACH|nr:LAME_0G19570g1_1 [Lachancea meyersii CBS 8951]
MPVNAIASNRVVIDGQIMAATIVFSSESGKIITVYENEVISNVEDSRLQLLLVQNYEIVSPHVIMAGIVDSHVHLNEPGRTEWEGFATGTRAAVGGGVTTVVDMPLNAIPPTTTVENLNIKLAAAEGQMWCDVAFWGGMVPSNLDELVPLVQSGVRGFKGFMMDSGVDEFPAIEKNYINRALKKLEGEKTILLFHAEQTPSDENHGLVDHSTDDVFLDHVKTANGGQNLSHAQVHALADSKILASVEPTVGIPSQEVYESHSSKNPLDSVARKDHLLDKIDPTAYAPFLASRPDVFETTAIGTIIACLTKFSKTSKNIPSVHVVHLATQEAVPMLRHAQKVLKLPISSETCFHYLKFAAESIPAKATHYKCCPPIRSEDNRKALWKALREGVITTVVSDHSPCTPELKNLARGDFFAAWGGISSVGLGLSIMITEGAKLSPPVTLVEISKWCCENTAKQVGLQHCKGFLRPGYDADFLVVDQYRKRIVSNDTVFFKNKLTAYDGQELRGQVLTTYVRGKIAYEHEDGHSNVPFGVTLLEPRTV